jgi:hypothetical protein
MTDTSTKPALPENMVKTGECRLSYPNLAKPRVPPGGGSPKFSAVLIFPKTTDVTAMQRALKAACKAKWGDQLPRGLESPFRDGAQKEGTPGYGPDVWYLNVSSEQQPQLFDAARRKVEGGYFKPGDYVFGALQAFAWEKLGKKGVSFGLRAIQYVREGERLGGGVDATAVFDVLENAKDMADDADALFGP